jgi:hypothetical protein
LGVVPPTDEQHGRDPGVIRMNRRPVPVGPVDRQRDPLGLMRDAAWDGVDGNPVRDVELVGAGRGQVAPVVLSVPVGGAQAGTEHTVGAGVQVVGEQGQGGVLVVTGGQVRAAVDGGVGGSVGPVGVGGPDQGAVGAERPADEETEEDRCLVLEARRIVPGAVATPRRHRTQPRPRFVGFGRPLISRQRPRGAPI